MKFIFEISISGNEWEVIPEQIFYDSLYRHVTKVTPLIKKMLAKEIIEYGNTRYKIRTEEIKK